MPAKVLWLIKGLGLGGAEKLLALAAPHLDRNRYEYQVAFLLPWKTALVAELEATGIPVTCLNHRVNWDLRVISRIARLLQREQIDILHAHLPYTGIVGRIAAQLAGTPHVMYTEHNVQERYHPLTRVLHQATLGLCDLTIAVSDEVRRSLLASPLVRRAPIRTILNGVDVDGTADLARNSADVRQEFGIAADRPIVGVVNVFRAQKRLDVWIQAARKIAEAEPLVSFMVVGDGPLRPSIEAQALKEGLQGRIHFPGLRRDALRLMAAFDVFMLASEYEGLPVAVLEAMALGRAVVATHVGGLPSAINDGEHGILVPPGNPDALASSVIDLLRNDDLRRGLGSAARERVRRNFSLSQMVSAMEQAYTDVLNGSAPDELAPASQESKVVS
jgi:glycosyltransferase involved in cell wall biosynthesis